MEIHRGSITLRDTTEADIEDDIRWNTVETQWRFWDAPWETHDPFDAESYRRQQLEWLGAPKDENRFRNFLELDYEGLHIGVVSSYRVNEDFSFDMEGRHRCIGILICEPDFWGRGIGSKAYMAYIDYLFSRGIDELYTQTWSGNLRMVRLAQGLGFSECHRQVDFTEVQGKMYDNLTLRLTAQAWRDDDNKRWGE